MLVMGGRTTEIRGAAFFWGAKVAVKSNRIYRNDDNNFPTEE
jgi:hypothetical protein